MAVGVGYEVGEGDGSHRRLEQALRRLEAAARARSAAPAPAGDAAVVQALTAERDSLRQALRQAEAENAAIRQLTAQVGERLDRAIGQLKLLLGG